LERSALEALLAMADGPDALRPTEEGVVRRRKKEDTAPREHVYLSQTVPPEDPVVREIERRRSGK